jgi:hypothetical protein
LEINKNEKKKTLSFIRKIISSNKKKALICDNCQINKKNKKKKRFFSSSWKSNKNAFFFDFFAKFTFKILIYLGIFLIKDCVRDQLCG